MRTAAAELTGRDRYDAQVSSAFDAVGVRRPGRFLWFGRRMQVAPSGPVAGVAPARDALVAAIERRLHEDFFVPGAPRPSRNARVAATDDGGEFARLLAQANSGRGSWQAGWHVSATGADAVDVDRPDGLRLVAPADDCRVEGARAAVRIPKGLAGLSPGFYIALGDTPARAGELVRLYWNVAAAGAVTLVARITYACNGANLPFALELPDNPARYGHDGAAGLVLARTDFAAAIKLLRPLLRSLSAHLADGAPAFTKPLARGLAIAEEPGEGQSFGAHRCHLLAEAIVGAGERGLLARHEQLAVARAGFAAAGIDLDTPYLQPGSDDAYELS